MTHRPAMTQRQRLTVLAAAILMILIVTGSQPELSAHYTAQANAVLAAQRSNAHVAQNPPPSAWPQHRSGTNRADTVTQPRIEPTILTDKAWRGSMGDIEDLIRRLNVIEEGTRDRLFAAAYHALRKLARSAPS